jgi:hypothetical protein
MNAAFALGVLIAVGKNLAGWIKNSIEDGEIQDYEILKGLETLAVTSIVYTGTYYGLEGLGVENAVLIDSIVTLLVTPLWDAWKKTTSFQKIMNWLKEVKA